MKMKHDGVLVQQANVCKPFRVDNVHSIQKEYNQNATTIEDFLNRQCQIDLTDRNNHTISRDLYHS